MSDLVSKKIYKSLIHTTSSAWISWTVYEWYSLQKIIYKSLVHTITFNIIVFHQQKLKNAGIALVITITTLLQRAGDLERALLTCHLTRAAGKLLEKTNIFLFI